MNSHTFIRNNTQAQSVASDIPQEVEDFLSPTVEVPTHQVRTLKGRGIELADTQPSPTIPFTSPKKIIYNEETLQFLTKVAELEAQGLYPEAEKLYKKIIRNNKQLWEIHLDFVFFYLRRKDYTKALTQLQRTRKVPDLTGQVLAHLWKIDGQIQHHQRSYDAALISYKKSLSYVPDDAIIYGNLASIHRALGEHIKAIPYYQKMLQIDPNNSDYWVALGETYFQADINKNEESKNCFRKALTITPKHPSALVGFGVHLSFEDKNKAAEKLFLEAISIDPNLADAYLNLGAALHSLGREDEAITAVNKSLEIDNTDPNSHYILGIIRHKNGELNAAVDSYSEAIKWFPKHHESWCNIGLIRQEQHRFPEALKYYKEYVKLKPKDPHAYNLAGLTCHSMGNALEALNYFNLGLALNKKEWSTHANLALVYRDIGLRDRYEMHKNEAITLNPEAAGLFEDSWEDHLEQQKRNELIRQQLQSNNFNEKEEESKERHPLEALGDPEGYQEWTGKTAGDYLGDTLPKDELEKIQKTPITTTTSPIDIITPTTKEKSQPTPKKSARGRKKKDSEAKSDHLDITVVNLHTSQDDSQTKPL